MSSNVAKASVLVEDLRARGFLVFSLPSGIVDKSSFFDAIRSCLPLDPPVVSNRSWDALSDSLWEGLSELAENRIAIVWPTEEVAAAEDMKIAMGVLDQVARLLADPVATVGKPKELVVVRI